MRNTISPEKISFCNDTGKLVKNIINNWLIGLRETNPAIIEMFNDRNALPSRDLLMWSGEFAGKYITGAYYIYQLTRNKELFEYIIGFIDELISTQAEDGYLGCYAKELRMNGVCVRNILPDSTWDTWSHYHIMYGLFLWYRLTGSQKYLDTILKAADFILNTFYQGKPRLVEIGWTEMNLAVIHIFALLFQETKNQKYLDFSLEIEKDLSNENAGDYLNLYQTGLEYFECKKPRWESLHIILGFTEMYRATGEEKYLYASKYIFYSILKTDIHNTGAFSTDEAAVGNPFAGGNIETCCVVAYNALACEIYALTGDLKIIDFLELSLMNAVKGYYSPTGRWSTYNTPMDGTKCANFHSIGFQCRPGSPELNCCSVNAPRGVGMLSEWALSEEDGTVYINCFESFAAEISDTFSVTVSGDYPADGTVKITLVSDRPQKVAIRIPEWSISTKVQFNRELITAAAGEYLVFEQKWSKDEIVISFDFSLRFLDGDLDCKGMKSIYIGPILYGYDLHLNRSFNFNAIPVISSSELKNAKPERQENGQILLKLTSGIILCDFYHLGVSGSQYKSWLKVK